MSDALSTLSDEQVVHAVKLFYECSPPELWEDDEKPSPEFVKTVAAAAVKQAPSDIQPAVRMLLTDDSDHSGVRAEVCRALLEQLRQQPAFQPTVDRAIDMAAAPNMAIDPITAAFVVVLVGIVAKKPVGFVNLIKALDLKGLLNTLPKVLKALPEGLFNTLKGAP